MPLDLSRVAAQIDDMAASLKRGEQDRALRLRRALEVLQQQEANLDWLKARIERNKTRISWPAAGLTDEIATRHEPCACPNDFTVVATDGSHIDVDRHSPARCYLINTGSVVLRYGRDSGAVLSSRPTLYAGPQDLVISDPAKNEEQLIEGALLGTKRAVAECQALADLGEKEGPPTLALLDGSLILWGIETYPDYVANELLHNGILPALDRMKATPGLMPASYISMPRSSNVISALRIAVCPEENPDCDLNCAKRTPSPIRPCDVLDAITDRDLFMSYLASGERSASFVSPSYVVQKHYGSHEVLFFYLRIDDEIARVELPRWVEERGQVDLLHALILDQCRRGQGYPVALGEAHEQAVLTASDRQNFEQLVQAALGEKRLSQVFSAKSRSKRTRWV